MSESLNNPENKKSSSEHARELNEWGLEIKNKWLELLEDAGLAEEFESLFKQVLEKLPETSPQKPVSWYNKITLIGSYRLAIIDGVKKLDESAKLNDASAQIRRNKRTNEKITLSQEELDAGNFFELLIEDTFAEEQNLEDKFD